MTGTINSGQTTNTCRISNILNKFAYHTQCTPFEGENDNFSLNFLIFFHNKINCQFQIKGFCIQNYRQRINLKEMLDKCFKRVVFFSVSYTNFHLIISKEMPDVAHTT